MMANDIRPEVSQKNPYWIGKHRYYELKHFCLQYPIWKKAYQSLDALSRRPADLQVFVKSGQMKGDPTERCAQSRIFFADRMEMVEQAAIGADPELYQYLIRGVTEGLSYDALKMKYDKLLYRPYFHDAVPLLPAHKAAGTVSPVRQDVKAALVSDKFVAGQPRVAFLGNKAEQQRNDCRDAEAEWGEGRDDIFERIEYPDTLNNCSGGVED